MIMIDPKMVELSIYEGIPHLLLPVVTDPKKANLALRWAVDEMERRYELVSKSGVRDILAYNKKVEKLLADGPPKIEAKKIKIYVEGDDGRQAARSRSRPTRRRCARRAAWSTPRCATRSRRRSAAMQKARAGGAAAAAQAALHRGHHRRVRRPHDGGAEGGRDLGGAHRAEGARRRHPPDARDAAPVGGRDHRPHQGQLPVAHRLPGGVEDRLAHHPRSAGRREPARHGRHAVHRSRPGAAARARRARHRRRDQAHGRLPQAAGPAGLRHGHPEAARRRGGRRRGRRRLPEEGDDRCTIRRCAWCARRAWRRSR